jgi:lysyl-tRNA synthetase class 2
MHDSSRRTRLLHVNSGLRGRRIFSIMTSGDHSDFCEGNQLAERRPALILRARIIQTIRFFFIERDYLEVETPHLVSAPAPEAHIDAIPAGDGLFLHTSPELCMKRMLSAGYGKIFQICRCWRGEERGGQHLPEFTLLEWYRTESDYMDIMDECEEMFLFIADSLEVEECVFYQGREINLMRPWDRLSVRDAFKRHAYISMEEALKTDRFDEVMADEIEPKLALHRPTFLYDYPAPLAALSKIKEGNPDLAERFELYMGGLEIANAFSELTNAVEQTERFYREREKRRSLGRLVYPMPDKFLDSLPRMPRSAGIALGVDRLVMLFGDKQRIDEVVGFTPE